MSLPRAVTKRCLDVVVVYGGLNTTQLMPKSQREQMCSWTRTKAVIKYLTKYYINKSSTVT